MRERVAEVIDVPTFRKVELHQMAPVYSKSNEICWVHVLAIGSNF